MSTPPLPEVVPETDANPVILLGRRGLRESLMVWSLTRPSLPYVKLKVTILEFARHKHCNSKLLFCMSMPSWMIPTVFSAQQHICIVRYMSSPVRLSVRHTGRLYLISYTECDLGQQDNTEWYMYTIYHLQTPTFCVRCMKWYRPATPGVRHSHSIIWVST